MSLVSAQYGIFLIAVCALSYLLPPRLILWLLLAASLLFYASGKAADVATLAAVILISYLGGSFLPKVKDKSLLVLWLFILATAAPLA